MIHSLQFLLSAVSSLFCLRTGLLPCASWGHCVWVTVPLRVTGRSSSRWGPHVTIAIVLGSSRERKIWKAKYGEWEGERKRLQRTLRGEKRGREKRERVSQQCLNLVRWWLPCQEVNRRFISFWGWDLFWCVVSFCLINQCMIHPVKRVLVCGGASTG